MEARDNCSTSYNVQDGLTPEIDLALDVSSAVEEPLGRPCEGNEGCTQGNWFLCRVPQGSGGITRSDSFINNFGCQAQPRVVVAEVAKASESG